MDASTLIYVAKADAYEEAERCIGTMLVAPSVWGEAVDAGEARGAPEVRRIRRACELGYLEAVGLSSEEHAAADRIAEDQGLGRGESEVVALALHRTGMAVIDEGRGTRVALAFGLEVASTLFLPLLARRRGSMSAPSAVRLLRRLAEATGARADTVFRIEEEIRRAGP